MTDKLKPCPFCGGQAKVSLQHYDCDNNYVVTCINCETSGWTVAGESNAISWWNHRPREDAMMRAVDVVREITREILIPGGSSMIVYGGLLSQLRKALADLDAMGSEQREPESEASKGE